MNLVRLAFALAALSAFAEDKADLSVVHRIKDEAFARSQVMEHLFRLTDANGPRLTNSPGYRSAADWAVKALQGYGGSNVHLEKWGRFGRGWSYSHFELSLQSPVYAPLLGAPKAWSGGTAGPVSANVVYAPVFTKEDKDLRFDLTEGGGAPRAIREGAPRPAEGEDRADQRGARPRAAEGGRGLALRRPQAGHRLRRPGAAAAGEVGVAARARARRREEARRALRQPAARGDRRLLAAGARAADQAARLHAQRGGGGGALHRRPRRGWGGLRRGDRGVGLRHARRAAVGGARRPRATTGWCG